MFIILSTAAWDVFADQLIASFLRFQLVWFGVPIINSACLGDDTVAAFIGKFRSVY